MKIYRKKKNYSKRPLIVIGALSAILIDTESSTFFLIGLHWKSSITWRFYVEIKEGYPKKRFLKVKHNHGGRAWLYLWGGKLMSFHWQNNMPRNKYLGT